MRQSLDSMNKNEIAEVLSFAAKWLHQIENLQNEHKKIVAKYRPIEGGYKKLWHGMRPVGGKIIVVILALILIGVLGSTFQALLEKLYFSLGVSVGVAIFLMYLIQFLLVLLVPAVVQVVMNKRIVKHNRKNADRLESNKESNRHVYVEEQAVKERISQASAEYYKVESLLPNDYKYDKNALQFMANLLTNGRADSMKDAINLYEEEMHRKRMEAKQDELIRKQEEANRIAVANMIASNIAASEQTAAMNRQAAAAEANAAAMNRAANELSRIRGY